MKKLNKITIIALTILIALASVSLGKAFAYFGSKSSASGSITMGHLYIDDTELSDSIATDWNIGNLQPNQSFGGSYKVDVNSNINYYIRILFKASVTPQAGSTHIDGDACGDYVTDDTDILSISIDGTTTGTYQKSTIKTADGYTPYYRLTPTTVKSDTTPETFNIDLKVADWVGSNYCGYYMKADVVVNMRVQVLQADYLESNTKGEKVGSVGEMHTLWTSIMEPIKDVAEYTDLYFDVLSADDKTMSVGANDRTLTTYNIPAMVKKDGEVYTVTQIREDGFDGCTNLTSVTIPNTVRCIDSYAFYCCTSLTSVTIPSGVTSIRDYTFHGCTSLASISLPSTLEYIGLLAFEGCSALTSITIPSSVTNMPIGGAGHPFEFCTSLTAINVDSANTEYSSIDGVVFNKDATELLLCPQGKSGSYTIPSSVTSIGWYAINACTGLTSISLPSTLTSIGEGAFYECSALKSITIPSAVTFIASGAFINCTNLTSVTFENTTGWHLDSTTGTRITVTNAVTNATNLNSYSGAWYGKDLYRA